jgi:ADP-ribose pyrophosphatase
MANTGSGSGSGVATGSTGDSSQGIPGLKRSLIHRGAKFDYEEVVIPGAGGTGTAIRRQVVRHPGSVVILPLLESPTETRIVLVRNLRVSVEGYLLELPAGTREKSEEPPHCAARELIEETGYRAATLEPLCRFHTGPGMTDELMHAFVATGLTHVGQHLEADEQMTVHAIPVDKVLDMIKSGEIFDAKTIATVLRWQMTRGG